MFYKSFAHVMGMGYARHCDLFPGIMNSKRSQFTVMNNIMNNSLNDKNSHNIVNGIMNDKNGHNVVNNNKQPIT